MTAPAWVANVASSKSSRARAVSGGRLRAPVPIDRLQPRPDDLGAEILQSAFAGRPAGLANALAVLGARAQRLGQLLRVPGLDDPPRGSRDDRVAGPRRRRGDGGYL